MSRLSTVLRRPITWVVAAALAAALLTFRDFGLTWDEPLFYGYADTLGYAYTPTNWCSGNFDLTQSYGPSPDDHKTRGPAYLLLTRLPAHTLQAAGVSAADSWHLVNSLTFLLGVCFVYGIARRVAREPAAALGATLFATQPMLWGHAFINPKDAPFMVFFAGAVWSGWRMVDQFLGEPARNAEGARAARRLLWPALLLGLATSIRVLGPLAGLLVAAYWLIRRPSWHSLAWIAAYAAIAAGIAFATWPYLWEDPLNFRRVFALMADNPTVLPVLFAGQVFPANGLPLRYLPFYLIATLTEPLWPLTVLGAISLALRKDQNRTARLALALLLAWLLIPLAYVLFLRPPMYDGMRHFLFMLPPAFILAARGIDAVAASLKQRWLRAALAASILVPGIGAILLLHPYEYTYFNGVTGGTGRAFRQYETDYWLTCYKEAVQELQQGNPEPARLFVHREAAVAMPYGGPGLAIQDERGATQQIRAGDYVLISTRTNEDLHTFRDAQEVLTVGRLGATYCVVRRVP